MKKFLPVLIGYIFSIHCAAQGRITDFQRILRTSDPAAVPEVELNLNKTKSMLNETLIESVFGHGLKRTQFSPFEKNQDLFSPSIEFLNIWLPDFQIFTGNVELFDRRDFGKPGITGYQGNFRLLNLPTRFGDFIAEDETAHKGYIDMHLPAIFVLRGHFCRFNHYLADCWCNPLSFSDPTSRRRLSAGNLIFQAVTSVFFHKMERLTWSSESR